MTGARIPRTRLVRRAHAKRWHLVRVLANGQPITTAAGIRSGMPVETECGQRIRQPEQSTTINAARIDCYDCLSDAVSRRLAARS